MDQELLNRLIERAMGDEEFRLALSINPHSALAELGATSEQIAQLENWIEQGAPLEELSERISKYLFGGAGPG